MMPRVVLPPPELARLAAILGRLGSEHSGEQLAAALAATRFVRTRELTWQDLLCADPPAPVPVQSAAATSRYWKHCAEEILFDHTQAITAWESGFLQDILLRGRVPTQKQAGVLRRIATKTGVPQW